MHEISLVRNIFNTLENEFPGRGQHLRGIYLKVGELSNIQPVLMQNAFAAVIQDEPQYKDATLHVEVLPIKIYCNDCAVESEVQKYKFICSVCNKPNNNLIQGDELLIAKVELENDTTGIESNEEPGNKPPYDNNYTAKK